MTRPSWSVEHWQRESRHRFRCSIGHKPTKKIGRLIEVGDSEVDLIQKGIQQAEPHVKDPHLIAIVIVSRCGIICSVDEQAFPYFKNKKLYPKKFPRPSIYSGKSNENLLCDQKILGVCKG